MSLSFNLHLNSVNLNKHRSFPEKTVMQEKYHQIIKNSRKTFIHEHRSLSSTRNPPLYYRGRLFKGPFRVLLCLCFKASLSANLSYENEFCTQFLFHANKSHFHKNGFALRLALKQRHKGTRKWPIAVP